MMSRLRLDRCVLPLLVLSVSLLVPGSRLTGEGNRLADLPSAAGPTRGPTFPSQNVALLSWLPVADFGPQHENGNDCWGYVAPSGREYAIMGLSDSTAFVEITDPLNPVVVDQIAHVESLWSDPKVFGHYAYSVNESGNGIQVIDLQNIDGGSVTLVQNFTGGGLLTSHNIAINTDSGFAYTCGSNIANGGLVAVSLANPANPAIAGTWSVRYVHDAQVVSYTSGPYAGREIAFCSDGGAGLDIVEVTDKANMSLISSRTYPGLQYTHQGWLSEDRQYLYVNDELDEINGTTPTTRTLIFDVSNLSNPVLIGTATSGLPSTDHNLYVSGDLLFEANYTSGLRIFDAADPTAPVEVAFFDTFPESNGAGFNGAWSTFPFFPSGTLIVSDLDRGLFVLGFDANLLAFSYPSGLPASLAPNVPVPLVVHIRSLGAAVDPATVTLHARIDGGPETQTPMTDAGSGDFEADLPAADCFSTVEFWVSAQNTLGTLFSDPPGAPAGAHRARVFTGLAAVFADNFETDQGWTVENISLATGAWVRVDPIGTAAQPEDDNPAGVGTMCYVTGQGPPGGSIGQADVDGGPTRLISPTFDFSAGDGQIGYAYWMYNDDADDSLVVEVSDDNGASWVEATRYTGGGVGWHQDNVVVSDWVSPNNQVRIRFSVADNPNNSITEAAIDDVEAGIFECAIGDFDGDGDVDLDDFGAFAACYNGANNPPAAACPPGVNADLDGDGDVDLDDFSIFAASYTGSL